MTRVRFGNIAAGLLLLFSLAGIQGCVTVPAEGAPTEEDIQDAVDSRVSAGLAYVRRGEAGPARRHLSRALELDGDSAKAHNAMALLYRYERDPENEEKHYRQALRADRDYAPARNNYGILLFTQERYDEARKHFLRAANNSSYESRGVAWGNLGRVYLAQGKEEKARNAFIKAVRLNPEESGAHLELAALYQKDGNFKLAWQYYQQYTGRTRTQSARGLWLGIQLASHFDKADKQSSYELALKRLYPGSPEYRKWLDWRDAGKAGVSGGDVGASQ
jgi:type IV pilus assembly protein PilF